MTKKFYKVKVRKRDRRDVNYLFSVPAICQVKAIHIVKDWIGSGCDAYEYIVTQE